MRLVNYSFNRIYKMYLHQNSCRQNKIDSFTNSWEKIFPHFDKQMLYLIAKICITIYKI